MLMYFPMQSNWPAVTAASECAHQIICRDAHRQRNSEVLPHRALSLQSTMLWTIIPFNQCLSASSVFDVLDEVTEPGHVVQHQPGSAWTQLKRQQWTEQGANMDVASKDGLVLEHVITLCLFVYFWFQGMTSLQKSTEFLLWLKIQNKKKFWQCGFVLFFVFLMNRQRLALMPPATAAWSWNTAVNP